MSNHNFNRVSIQPQQDPALQGNFPHESSPSMSRPTKIAKRSRSINRPTIPLRDSPAGKSIGKCRSPARTRSRDNLASSYSLRPMMMQDIASVYHIGNEIFTASEFPNMYRTWDDFSVIENYASSGEFCFVAQAHGEILGFLLGETMSKRVGLRGYIQWVAVLPQYRRMGIAASLISEFTRAAQSENISFLLADTPADNLPALHMFEKAGLTYKTDHVYLTRQLGDVDIRHVDEEDMTFSFSYTAKKKKITIWNMEIDDLYSVHTVGEKVFTDRHANLYNFWDEGLVLQSYLSDPELCAVATCKEKEEDKVVGFAFGTTIEKPRSSWKYGYLVWLGCAHEYQGIGLASQLYNVMLELFALEKVRMVLIDTQATNEGALKFFRKMGFGHDEEHVYLCNSPIDTDASTSTVDH